MMKNIINSYMPETSANQTQMDTYIRPAGKPLLATRTQQIVAGGILAFVVIAIFGFFGWNYFIKVHTKVISGINYYNQEVTVTLNGGESQTLKPFDTYEFRTATDKVVTVEVKDADGKVILTRTHSPSRKSGVAIDILADESDGYAYCYVDADVRGSFYEKSGDEVKDLNILSREAKTGYYFDMAQFTEVNEHYLVPSRYNGDKLPAKLDSDTSVRGIYPVECANLDDQEKIKEDIKSWGNYDPAALRDYLQQLEEGLLGEQE